MASMHIFTASTTDIELITCWQHGRDQRARDELIRRHQPIVNRLARRYLGAREPLDDLIQVASYALIKAIDRFDTERSQNFRGYLIPTISGEIKRYFRDSGWAIRVPRSTQELALAVEKAQRKLGGQLGRSPTVQQLAQFMEISVEDVVDGLEANFGHHAKSLDAPVDDDEGTVVAKIDTLGCSDHGYALAELRMDLATALEGMSDLDRRVTFLRFSDDLTQTEISEQVGVSQMQVSRILTKCAKRLRVGLPERAGALAA